MQGGTANVGEINNVDVEEGRFFTNTEDQHAAMVAVIGSDVKDQLFGKLDPLGRTINIAGHPARVIGLLRKQGSVLGRSQDNQLFIPITAYRKAFGIEARPEPLHPRDRRRSGTGEIARSGARHSAQPAQDAVPRRRSVRRRFRRGAAAIVEEHFGDAASR